MIPDWETNHLFLSDRLEDSFPALVASLRSVLSVVTIDIIPRTSDIWCRDYMPIQVDEDRFCQFVYAPDYHACTNSCSLAWSTIRSKSQSTCSSLISLRNVALSSRWSMLGKNLWMSQWTA